LSDWTIIGLGNPLMGDDGAGLEVLEILRRGDLPAAVELVDAGTIGLGLLHLLEGAARVILVDAVDMGLETGAVRRFTPEQVCMADEPLGSLHQAGVAQVLLLGKEMGLLPGVLVLFGVQPGRVERHLGLSARVAQAVAQVAELIAAEVG